MKRAFSFFYQLQIELKACVTSGSTNRMKKLKKKTEERMSMFEKKIHKDVTSAIEKYRKQNVKYSIV